MTTSNMHHQSAQSTDALYGPLSVRYAPATEKWCVVSDHATITCDTWNEAMATAKALLPEIKAAPGWKIQRRLQALAAAGWSIEWIASRLKLPAYDVRVLTTGEVVTISPKICVAVTRLYDTVLANTCGGMIQSGGPTDLARANEWPAPAAWDDIDDPEEEHVSRVHVTGPMLRQLDKLLARHRTPAAVARLLGVTPGIVADIRGRRTATLNRVAAVRLAATTAGTGRTAPNPQVTETVSLDVVAA